MRWRGLGSNTLVVCLLLLSMDCWWQSVPERALAPVSKRIAVSA